MEENLSFLKNKILFDSPNKNIVPTTTKIDKNGDLSIANCSINDLIEKYGSPLYLLDEMTLRSSCRAYKKALEKFYPAKSLPIYASKANSSLFMSNLIHSEGLGLDAVSEGELITALSGGLCCSRLRTIDLRPGYTTPTDTSWKRYLRTRAENGN